MKAPSLRTLLVLGRVSNVPTVWANIIAAWLLGGGGWRPDLIWTLLGATLLYVAGMTLNDACDAKWDAAHAPDRPIPSGKISRGLVWATGASQMLSGTIVLLVMTDASPAIILALVLAILWYDVAHKGQASAPWIMGLCRLLLYPLAASAASRQEIRDFGLGQGGGGLIWLYAASLYAYVVALTYTAKAERVAAGTRAAGGSWWVWGLLAIPFILNLIAGQWWAGLPFLAWILLARWLRQTGRVDIGRLVGLLLAGMVLVDVMAASVADWRLGLSLALLVPLNLALQRSIPAT